MPYILAYKLERSSSHGSFEKYFDESRGEGADAKIDQRQWKMRQATLDEAATAKYKAYINMDKESDTLQSVGKRIVWPFECGEKQN